MNIACIYSVVDYVSREKPLVNQACISMGIASIATVLEKAGHRVETVVFAPITPVEEHVREFMVRLRPRLVCLSAVSTQFPTMLAVAKAVKKIDPSVFVILGGHHASLNPEATMAHREFDAICIGEGERAVIALAAALADGQAHPTGIANLWIRSIDAADGIERNRPAPFIEDLATIPAINRELWIPHVAHTNHMPSILLGRGCPNRCTYCSNHAMAKLTTGRYVRLRPIPHILDELRSVAERFPLADVVYFEVETLGVNVDWAIRFCDELAAFNASRAMPMRFGSNLAVGKHLIENEKLLDAFQRANFTFMNIGLESGSERIRNEILRRPRYTNAEITAFCEKLRRRGIDLNLFVLIGVPSETLADWHETVSVIRACQPQFCLSSIFHPYPGTDLHQYALDHGLLADDPTRGSVERKSSHLRLPGFSRRQIQREYMILPWRVFHDRWPKRRVLAQIVKNVIGLDPRLDAFCRYVFNANPVLQAIKKSLSAYKA